MKTFLVCAILSAIIAVGVCQDIPVEEIPDPVWPEILTTTVIASIDPECPTGYRYDAINGNCIQNTDPVCPPGKVWHNGTCVEERYTNVLCPEGYTLTHFKCVKMADPVCPAGTEYRNGYCIEIISTPTECPHGYRKEGNTCVLNADPVCPTGWIWRNNVCVKVAIVCPEGFVYENQICVQRRCPPTHFWSDGVCKLKEDVAVESCPDGQHLVNGVCQTIVDPPTPTLPPPDAITKCPDGMEFFAGRCRVFYCPPGYLLDSNRCIQIACPNATVWTGSSCEAPPEIRSVIEITHEIFNHLNGSTPNVTLNNVNQINVLSNGTVLSNCCPDANGGGKNCTQPEIEDGAPDPIIQTTTERPAQTTPIPVSNSTCCTLITPRVCKRFDERWICVNRRYNQCGSFCSSPTIYLKPPKVIHRPPIMVLPPNPPMQVCPQEENCSGESIDCSGCPESKPETCSSYCYEYHCTHRDCTFIDQEVYCKQNPGSPGCTESDGCLDEWCSDNPAWNPNQDVLKPCV